MVVPLSSLRSSTCACGAPPNMKMGLRSVASIINISFDGRPPVSLGTAVVDPRTISPCSSDKMLGSVLCARKVHLFSEQEPDVYSYDKQHTEPLRRSEMSQHASNSINNISLLRSCQIHRTSLSINIRSLRD